MDTAFEHRVRERAYQLWVAAGMTEGSADQHWLAAERAVLSEAVSAPARGETAPKAAKAAKAPAKAQKPAAPAAKVEAKSQPAKSEPAKNPPVKNKVAAKPPVASSSRPAKAGKAAA
jgi:hypothetical protein